MIHFFISQCNKSKSNYKINLVDLTLYDNLNSSFYDQFGFIHNKKNIKKYNIIDRPYVKTLILNKKKINKINNRILHLIFNITDNGLYNLNFKRKLIKKLNNVTIQTDDHESN